MKNTIRSFSSDVIKLLEQGSNLEMETLRKIIPLVALLILNHSQKKID